MSKRKRSENEENYNTKFRRYSLELHKHAKICKREPPPLMITPDFGPTKSVWSILCSKDEMNERNWRALKKQEHVTNQYRCMIVDWLMEVSASLKFHRETFHLAVDYFDRYLCVATDDIPLQELQLVATSALAISSKYEEIYPPKLNVLADYTDGGCNANDVITFEQIMLQELNWNFNTVTAIHWLAFYLQLVSKTNEKHSATITKIHSVSPQLAHEETVDGTVANTSFSDSFLRSIDGTHNALNDSITSSCGTNNAENEGHVYIEQSLSVPKLFREDFIQLAKVVDLLILDHHFLSYRYSELAAAVLFCCYQPSEDIEKVTSIKKESITKLIGLVQIFADYCEDRNLISHKTFIIEDIEPEELHNIQRYEDNNYDTLKKIFIREKQRLEELNGIKRVLSTQNQEDVLKEQNS